VQLVKELVDVIKMNRKALALSTAAVTAALAGGVLFGPQAIAHDVNFRAKLRDADGRVVGRVDFSVSRDSMYVEARLRPNQYVKADQFHGFHVHANNDRTNDNGCVADASAPRSTWFVSADGHLSEGAQDHGAHSGDLPSPLVMADGSARLAFRTDRIDPEVLRGRAVVLHDRPDNFGNVPVGSAEDQYRSNGKAALTATAKTGNAGDRVACGVIRRSW
jgi:Cu-Zn family superoxide dismutase